VLVGYTPEAEIKTKAQETEVYKNAKAAAKLPAAERAIVLVGFTLEAEVKSKANREQGLMPTWLDEMRGGAPMAGSLTELSFGLSEA
jgi:hypothetical protein